MQICFLKMTHRASCRSRAGSLWPVPLGTALGQRKGEGSGEASSCDLLTTLNLACHVGLRKVGVRGIDGGVGAGLGNARVRNGLGVGRVEVGRWGGGTVTLNCASMPRAPTAQ